MKLKVGDKVRARKGYELERMKYELTPGMVYTVKEVLSINNDLILLTPVDHGGTYDSYRLELVEETNRELEQLVETANKGLAARLVMKEKYSDRVVMIVNGDEREIGSCKSVDEYKIKSKPKFETFITKVNGWVVRLSEGLCTRSILLRIGCKEFDPKEFREVLIALVKNNKNTLHSTVGDFNACRLGVRYKEHILAWEDAERILKQLEECL